MERRAKLERETSETDIKVFLDVDGSGQANISTGIGFFDHMLNLLAKHGLFDMDIQAAGDLDVDGHHTVEDVGIVLGQAFNTALAAKQGIKRYGTAFVPMDEALAMVSIDISGRPFLVFDAELPVTMIGDFHTELTEEFLRAFAMNAKITLHVRMLSGKNSHHIVEAIFKALARALDEASRCDERIIGVLSTKGVI